MRRGLMLLSTAAADSGVRRATVFHAGYPSLTRQEFLDEYVRDVSRAADPPLVLFPDPPSLDSTGAVFRVVQWNINALFGLQLWGDPSQPTPPEEIGGVLAGLGADVLVMQEFGEYARTSEGQPVHTLAGILEAGGYTLKIANTTYPTAVASRLPLIRAESVTLDTGPTGRAAMAVELAVGGRTVRVVGTHLDHQSASRRRDEIDTLMQSSPLEVCMPTLISADFNSARPQDHLPEEWELIAASKRARGSAVTDGIFDALGAAGYSSC
eukprot:Hpha_TRINITY_DN26742_c0_g1::TRINITY_DN26742_c0_g1_i1::g.138964::m.138964